MSGGESVDRLRQGVCCRHCGVLLVPSGGGQWRDAAVGSSACEVNDESQPWTYHEPVIESQADDPLTAAREALCAVIHLIDSREPTEARSTALAAFQRLPSTQEHGAVARRLIEARDALSELVGRARVSSLLHDYEDIGGGETYHAAGCRYCAEVTAFGRTISPFLRVDLLDSL